jgi:hypothetical protein
MGAAQLLQMPGMSVGDPEADTAAPSWASQRFSSRNAPLSANDYAPGGDYQRTPQQLLN